MKRDEQQILDLIGLTYEAAMVPEKWADFLKNLARFLHTEAAFLRISDTSTDQVQAGYSYGHNDQYMSYYKEHFIKRDPYRAALKAYPAGKFYPGQAALSYDNLVKTDFYNDLLRPNNLHYTLGGFAVRDGPLVLQVAVQRSKHTGDFRQEEIDRFSQLIPHLQRAFKINRHITHLEHRGGMAEQALDQLGIGIILVDESKQVCFLNRKADAIITTQQGLRLTSSKLSASTPQDNSQLQQLIQEAVLTGLRRGTDSAGAIRIMPDNHSGTPLSILVTPLNPSSIPTAFATPQVCAGIFIGSSNLADRPDTHVIQMLYDLTPSEARLAAELTCGFNLNEICDHFNISYHTARSHLKIIFQKTYTNRQAELVSLILSSPAAL